MQYEKQTITINLGSVSIYFIQQVEIKSAPRDSCLVEQAQAVGVYVQCASCADNSIYCLSLFCICRILKRLLVDEHMFSISLLPIYFFDRYNKKSSFLLVDISAIAYRSRLLLSFYMWMLLCANDMWCGCIGADVICAQFQSVILF